MIKKSDIKKWVGALRSADYPQTSAGALNDSKGYCCLGVACDVFIPKNKQSRHRDSRQLHGGFPKHQEHAPEWLKRINDDFSNRIGIRLSELNDCGVTSYVAEDSQVIKISSLTFDEIADLLELVYIHGAMRRVYE